MHNEYIDILLECHTESLTIDRAFVAMTVGIIDGFDYQDDAMERMHRLIDAYALLTAGKKFGFREMGEYTNVDIEDLPVLPKSMVPEYYDV